jgi:hypothetical protein
MEARERPRPWHPLDNAFLTRGSIDLADQFPGFGPLAIVALIAETNGAVGGGKRKDFDVLEWQYSYLARRIRVEPATASAIIHVAEALTLVEMLEEDGDRFKLRLPRWSEWHPKDPGAAERKRRQRRNASNL